MPFAQPHADEKAQGAGAAGQAGGFGVDEGQLAQFGGGQLLVTRQPRGHRRVVRQQIGQALGAVLKIEIVSCLDQLECAQRGDHALAGQLAGLAGAALAREARLQRRHGHRRRYLAFELLEL